MKLPELLLPEGVSVLTHLTPMNYREYRHGPNMEGLKRFLDRHMRVVPQEEVERRMVEGIEVFNANELKPGAIELAEYIDAMYPPKNVNHHVSMGRIHGGLNYLERTGVISRELLQGAEEDVTYRINEPTKV